MKIGCLTGGGDAVGLNAAIAGFVRRMLSARFQTQIKVVGILGGWQGLSSYVPEFTPLGLQDVRGITGLGGTILHTSRDDPMKDEAEMARVEKNATLLDGVVAMGGDNTFTVAAELSRRGHNVIAVPKTMDLDLSGTQYSVGFWSYVESVVDALRGFTTTCKSHRRIGVCEVFGRYSGFTAAAVGIAADADYIIVPEQKLDFESLAQVMRRNYDQNRTGLVVVAEGINLDTGRQGQQDQQGNELLAQRRIAEFIAKIIESKTNIETRPFQAGHPFRGEPFAYDAIIGYRFGTRAAEMVLNKDWGKMVALVGGDAISGDIVSLPISDFKPRRIMDSNPALYHLVASRNR